MYINNNLKHKFLILILKLIKKGHYLNLSKPPIAGEPIKTANVTIMPKTIITITNRLFILQIIPA